LTKTGIHRPMSPTVSPLIGVEIFGGLGNQMFQYAAALALSRRLGAELCCDTHLQKHSRFRPLGLEQFGLTWRECINPRARGALRALGRCFGLGGQNPFGAAAFFEEEEGRYNPEFARLRGACFLKGYFQSWRYFEGHEPEIRRAFDTGRLATARTAPLEARIRAAEQSVAIHIRRGDFSDTAKNAALRGPLGPEYYRAARAHIEGSVKRPTFFLFSDDVAAAAAELSDWPDLVPVAGLSPHEDLRLMALCKHFIIANSTFSWWAAWLSAAEGKIVVAPSRWFGPAYPHQFVLEDRVLPDWLTI
jgi:hypothetical protein